MKNLNYSGFNRYRIYAYKKIQSQSNLIRYHYMGELILIASLHFNISTQRKTNTPFPNWPPQPLTQYSLTHDPKLIWPPSNFSDNSENCLFNTLQSTPANPDTEGTG